MSSDLIIIKIEADEAIRQLEAMEKRGRDLSAAMKEIAGIMHDAMEQNFADEGDPKWKELAGSTIKQREKKGHWPGKILQEAGSLVSSIEPGSDATSAWVGTNKVYAAIHHFGGKAGRGLSVEIPARPFMTLPDTALDEISEAVGDFIVGT
jgi:phage virion morphogenesis protein